LETKKLVVVLTLCISVATWVYFKDRRDLLKKIYMPGTVTVFLQGNVSRSGIYQIPAGADLQDLLELSGNADSVNPKEIQMESSLFDGQIVRIGMGK